MTLKWTLYLRCTQMRYKTCQQAEANLYLSLGFQRRGGWHFKHLYLHSYFVILTPFFVFLYFVSFLYFVWLHVCIFAFFVNLTTFNCRTVLLAFINCLVISTPQLKERNRLRNEFIGKFCSLILAWENFLWPTLWLQKTGLVDMVAENC